MAQLIRLLGTYLLKEQHSRDLKILLVIIIRFSNSLITKVGIDLNNPVFVGL